MERTVVAAWEAWAGGRREELKLRIGPDGAVADATVAPADGGTDPVRYRIACDAAWRTRRVEVALGGRRLDLAADGAGRWRDGTGADLPSLAGALDVDVQATPFTNTLPIRRLGLAPGASAEVAVAYVAVPSLRCTCERQRYARLDARRYRFEALDGAFVRALDVDGDGLVRDYPELFRRVA